MSLASQLAPRSRVRSRFDARRKPRALTNAQRLARTPTLPIAAERFMQALMAKVAIGFMRAVWKVVAPHIEEYAMKPAEDEEKQDARLDAKQKVSDVLRKQMSSAAAGSYSKANVDRGLQIGASRVLDHSKKEFKRLGLHVDKEPGMTALISGWRKDAVAKITKMHQHELSRVEKILEEGLGHRPETLGNMIKEQLGVSKSRADFIARDQTLTLNGKISRHRQQAAGFDKYIWTTAGDDRVRDEHEDLEGEKISWDDPPEDGHPGEDYNCRCVAFPLDESDADGEDEDGEEDED